MTVQECYRKMGGDYEDVVKRLRREERIRRFLLMVPQDTSFTSLCSAMEEKNMAEAFRAAHTLKGICQNLSLTRLGRSVGLLTELLREQKEYSEDLLPVFEEVKKDYTEITGCIQELVC